MLTEVIQQIDQLMEQRLHEFATSFVIVCQVFGVVKHNHRSHPENYYEKLYNYTRNETIHSIIYIYI